MDGEEVSQLLGEIESQIVAVAQVHRLLSRHPTAKSVDLCENLTQLSRTLMSALDPGERIEVIRTASEACLVGRNTLLPVSLIVTELLTNSLKHAHPRGEKGRIMIGCRKGADGSVVVEVGDDGDGFGEDFDPESTGGLGFRTIRLLAQRLGAQLTHATGPMGVCFTLRLPPSQAG